MAISRTILHLVILSVDFGHMTISPHNIPPSAIFACRCLSSGNIPDNPSSGNFKYTVGFCPMAISQQSSFKLSKMVFFSLTLSGAEFAFQFLHSNYCATTLNLISSQQL